MGNCTTISNQNVIGYPSGSLVSSIGNIWATQKSKYIVFDQEVEIDGYLDTNTAMVVSLINLLGKPYYDEIKKQGISFDCKIENVMLENFKIHERDKKINTILDGK